MLKMQEEEVAKQRAMVEDLSGKLDTFLLQYNTQRIIMWMVIVFAVLLVLIATQAYWGYTNSRRLNAELMELSRQLEENTRAKLDFFTNVSHDLRTPLSLVAGPLEHVLEGSLQDDQKETLLLARRNVDILRRLVNNILDFRKIESGNMPLTLYRFDLPSAVREWMSGFDGTSRTIRYDGTGSLEVEADMRLLECILFNLLGNSIKRHRKFFIASVIMMALSMCGMFFGTTKAVLYVAIALVGFGNSNIFSIVFSQALLAVPEKQNEVSGLMIMGLFGGTVFPLLMGFASDAVGQAGAVAVMTIGVIYLFTYLSKVSK